ncbi:GGDEF domain-containing protein [Marinimicrobium sp. ARAG 43.8]|uniref:GGDEF domain-containing protein n=1 Tax=Marinimicrobium sp. ARAG 43.8 TaxID=3418719 RepID=UPI003CEDBA74
MAVGAHDYLPKRRVALDLDAYVYSDDLNSVEYIDFDKRMWRCVVTTSEERSFCGMNLLMSNSDQKELDLSEFQTLHLNIKYRGDSPLLRYYFRNREPGFSEGKVLETHKFLQAQISTDYISENLEIHLDEFDVAEWWLAQHKVPRELSRPNFEHVTAFGVDLSYPLVEGDHFFHLVSAEVVGNWVSKERWYRGIIGMWLFVWLCTSVGSLVYMRRKFLRERHRTQEYKDLSQKDQLTRLLNRHGLTVAIEQLFSAEEMLLSLLVVDVDNFKKINDQFGHDLGDQVLVWLGEILQDCVRQSDFVGRWGGEEFIVLLPLADVMAAEKVAEKIRQEVECGKNEKLDGYVLTVSVGVAERGPHENYNHLFKRADAAVYKAKRAGRNQTVVAEADDLGL